MRACLDDRADIGIAVATETPEGMDAWHFTSDPLIALLPAGHALAGQSAVGFRDLAVRGLVGIQAGGALDQLLHERAQAERIPLRFGVTVNSFDAACRMVPAGLGAAIVPTSAVTAYAGSEAFATPVHVLSHYDDRLRRFTYTGVQAGGTRPFGPEAARAGAGLARQPGHRRGQRHRRSVDVETSHAQPLLDATPVVRRHRARRVRGCGTGAPKDGLTLGRISSSHLIHPRIYRRVPFDSLNDITPITVIGTVPLVLVVHPSVKASSTKDLVTPEQASAFFKTGLDKHTKLVKQSGATVE